MGGKMKMKQNKLIKIKFSLIISLRTFVLDQFRQKKLQEQAKKRRKKRAIKVKLPNTAIKQKIMNNLKNLKDKGYNRISITDDYTVTERKIIKDFVEKAKEANSNESPDSENIWVVRGCPKNGLFLKRLTRKNRPANQ